MEQLLWLVVGGIVLAVLELIRTREQRPGELKRWAELYESLPEGSEARERVLEYISIRIQAHTEREHSLARDPSGAVVGLIMLGLGGVVTWQAFSLGGWFWILIFPAGFLGIFGLFGFVDSLMRRDRTRRRKGRSSNGSEA